ncbi:acyltransferase [Marinactinospora thermotolerans]|uniref:Surface polysaccharide O-acyltransferase, integral membrane enzyme n=1 Tax=Marinactinospora thermotolerans DSM 45154 TaxID=1122192 RepID=A0A1T4KC28_9ACTN|nr:acyltransferase family protein [Marinactinospora thermotolerans]SJZ39936.1 Surface polysaccharide O-acyltransferase, integral membrane enzyme [Marinactinospora thermotolerans DSM 45154]
MTATSPVPSTAAQAAHRTGRGPEAPARVATPAATAWLDITRVLAMLAVIVVHAFAPIVTTRYTDYGTATWWAANAADSLVRWCVPVFIMISGALLLKPREEGLRSFYRRRFSRIGIPLVVWTGIYLVLEHTRWGGITLSEAIGTVLSGDPALHLYFLFVLAGLYVLTPFLRIITRYATTRMLWWFAIMMSALGMVDQAVTVFDGAGGPNAVTRFLPYVGYYVMGYLLRETDLTRRQTWGVLGAFAGSILVTGLGAGLIGHATGGWTAEADYLYTYLSPSVMVMSVTAFLLLRAFGRNCSSFTASHRDTEPARRRLKTLSDLSFGVFLVHVVVLYELRGLTGVPDHPIAMLAMASFHILAVLTVSLAVTALFKRIPVLRATV